MALLPPFVSSSWSRWLCSPSLFWYDPYSFIRSVIWDVLGVCLLSLSFSSLPLVQIGGIRNTKYDSLCNLYTVNVWMLITPDVFAG